MNDMNVDLNSLLNRFTISSVQLRRKRKTEALNSWKPIVNEILACVKAGKKCFANLQIIHSGSYYEKTKVGEPDEFDLMLVMDNVEFEELPGFACSKPPTGFTRGVMTNNRYSAIGIKAVFASLVQEAIKELGYESNVTVRSQGPAVTLKITNRKEREYSIDLTLAIKYESWPEDAEEWPSRRDRKGWPNQKLVQEIYQDGCHLVAKHPKGYNVHEQEKGFLWRYSFSAAEKKLFLQGGHGEASSCWKQVLRILKAVREELNLKPLNSYHLKTILLYECEANPLPSQWSSTHLGERFKGLLRRLENCLMQSNCPHYFIPHLNLLKTFSRQSCRDLARKVREIRLQPGEVFNNLILQSLQQSVQQALEQSLVQALKQAMAQALEKALQQDQMHLLEQAVKQAVEEAVEQALRQSQVKGQEQFLEEALGTLLQALSAQAEALEESMENALVQELEQELEQVWDQALLEGQGQAWEQAFVQALEQALGKALWRGMRQPPGKAQGQAMGQSLGQTLGQAMGQALVPALQRTLEQSLEQLASFVYLLTYYFILSLYTVRN
ncbi:cyclic GMP-AMP synthase-like receptor 1 [Oculina patagonica]